MTPDYDFGPPSPLTKEQERHVNGMIDNSIAVVGLCIFLILLVTYSLIHSLHDRITALESRLPAPATEKK